MDALQEYKSASVTVTYSMVGLNISQNVCVFLGTTVNLLMAIMAIEQGTFNVGDFILVNTYLIQMYMPLNFLGTMWRFIRQSMVDVDMIFELLDEPITVKDPPNPELCRITEGSIEFRNVSFKYDSKSPDNILHDVSFRVPPFKSYALVGATGSGKSTIMRLLYRFYDIEQGQILIDGQDIAKITLGDLRSSISIVPQDCVLFNDTVLYNISYGGVRDRRFKQRMESTDPRDQ